MLSDYLPDEVVRLPEILHKLPGKSLIRFRCVSKLWNSRITSPAFINSRLTQSLSLFPNTLVVRHCASSSPYIQHYKLFRDENDSFDQIQQLQLPVTTYSLLHFKLIGSVNCLFCLNEQGRFILWNPTINKSITLPKPSITANTHGHFICCRLAFGFDPRTNDYKVVRIAFPCKTNIEKNYL